MNNVQRALQKFNSMYDRISTQGVSHDEIQIVVNYGYNLVKMYANETNLDEIILKINSCASNLKYGEMYCD